MGPVGRPAQGPPECLPSDAAPWPQHVGYTPYPEEVTEAFVNEAAATGIDIFRIFDALNDVNQMLRPSARCGPPAQQ
ncbi:pyruvate carboxylase subunit B [Arthrobacter sp. Hiyo1]|nr:pyruvate carboxylase subunit B [Arthrobacter sp. Hiyo1]